MKFSIIHPSRSRPHKSLHAIQNWLNSSSTQDFEVIISLDESDSRKGDYLGVYANQPKVRVIVRENNSAIEAINNAAKESTGDIIIVASDDTECVVRWDEVILKAVEGKSDYVLKVYDGIQKWIVTMPVMDRTYYNRYGYVYNPIYKHMFCDTELAHVAEITGRIIFRNDINFPHRHYSVTKERRDYISEVADASFNDGRRTYMRRFKDKFGLQDVDVWNISNQGHINWLKSLM